MSGAYTYPGVYIQELPSPVHTINGVPTAITALVGAATRGPVNEPISIFSVADYQRAFGADSTLPLDQAVSLFYQNGGGAAIIVRVVPASLVAARPPAGSLPAEGHAISPGAWGNNLSITVNQAGLSAAPETTMYSLTVTLTTTDKTTGAQQKTVEQYVGISVDPTSTRSLKAMIASSNL